VPPPPTLNTDHPLFAHECARFTNSALPLTRVIGLSALAVTRFAEALPRAGALGYVLKERPAGSLFEAIIHLSSGCRFVPASGSRRTT
jgi:DNA-binding NarL/FixJ family response regulator